MNDPKSFDELIDPDFGKKDGSDAFLDPRVSTVDPKSIKDKGISDKARALQDENDIRDILLTPQGIRFICRLFDRCGYDQPYTHPNNGIMNEIAGRREIARAVSSWIMDADYEACWKPFHQYWNDHWRPKPKTSQRTPQRQVTVKSAPRSNNS